jgi:hypothetical protein
MADALAAADRLDPRECRRSVKDRFSPERMTQDYLDVYQRAMEARPAGPVNTTESQRGRETPLPIAHTARRR